MPDSPQLPAIADAPLSVILYVPTTDTDLNAVLRAWWRFLEGLSRSFEIILLQNAKSGRVSDWWLHHPQFQFVQPSSADIGGALRSGINAAQYPLLAYADGSAFAPNALAALLETIDKVDLVSGVRNLKYAGMREHLGHLAYRWLLRILFGVRLKDPDCFLKLFRREVFPRIPIQSEGPFVQSEIVAKANFLGKLMTEVPVASAGDQHPRTTAWRALWRDARRIFFHPDFGPPAVPARWAR